MSEIIVKLNGKHIKIKGGDYVQDLVRCKECIWRDTDNQGEDYCTYAKGLADINESSFCSWGKESASDD